MSTTADINFDCPACGQNLDAPAEMGGLAIPCPACGHNVNIPQPVTPADAPPPDVVFDCPACGQNLDGPADMAGMVIACPACGHAVDVPRPAPAARPAEADATKGSTIRINLDALGGLPPTPQPRRVFIKRAAGR